MKKKIIVVLLLIVMVLSMTACGEDPVENAVIPMDSITQNITESGIYAYASSLKSVEALKKAYDDGDIGSYTFTLLSDASPVFFNSPWWIPDDDCLFTNDTVIISGNVGDCYYGNIECFFCDYNHSVEGTITNKVTSQTFDCNCNGLFNHEGMRKIITITVIPIA